MIKAFNNLAKLGFNNNLKFFGNRVSYNFSQQENMAQFTQVFDKKAADDKNIKISSGRAWRAAELRLKSTDDLHKLWYVLLKEKNAIVSDNALKKKLNGSRGPQGKMSQLKVSMARLLTVVNERKKIREQYRKHLEDEYVKQQRVKFEQELREKQQNEVMVPEITHQLMRDKYRALRDGVDNTNYIKEKVQKLKARQELKDYLDDKYDYRNKQVVEQEDFSDASTQIPKFTSLFEQQIKEGKSKISEQEVLRAHVKNWKMLNLKQRRIIINFLQGRRARDAKKEFLKELDLLGQKIAYDSMQERTQQQQ